MSHRHGTTQKEKKNTMCETKADNDAPVYNFKKQGKALAVFSRPKSLNCMLYVET